MFAVILILLILYRSKPRSKPKKKGGQRRSRTPSSVVDGSAWEVTRTSGNNTLNRKGVTGSVLE